MFYELKKMIYSSFDWRREAYVMPRSLCPIWGGEMIIVVSCGSGEGEVKTSRTLARIHSLIILNDSRVHPHKFSYSF